MSQSLRLMPRPSIVLEFVTVEPTDCAPRA
jgi:hypothetical protein